jgi:hypothetical protein
MKDIIVNRKIKWLDQVFRTLEADTITITVRREEQRPIAVSDQVL